eukprot:GDKJ01021228.1.p1 GENE.GDKJ01021228.1~~GDKJ01021228.1.p1  ORF type:complete len:863 (+),score=186.52 GDKJ01021228.1:376-2589(+)
MKIFGYETQFPNAEYILYIDEDTLMTDAKRSISDLADQYLVSSISGGHRPYLAVMADGTCYEKLLLINSGVILFRNSFFNLQLNFILLSQRVDITYEARETRRFVGGGPSDQAALIALLIDIGALDGRFLNNKCRLAQQQQLHFWRYSILRKFTFPTAVRMLLGGGPSTAHPLMIVDRAYNSYNGYFRPYLRPHVLASTFNVIKNDEKLNKLWKVVKAFLELRHSLFFTITTNEFEFESLEADRLNQLERILEDWTSTSFNNTITSPYLMDEDRATSKALSSHVLRDWKERLKKEWPNLLSLQNTYIKNIKANKPEDEHINFNFDAFDSLETELRQTHPSASKIPSTLFFSQPYSDETLKFVGKYLWLVNQFEKVEFTPTDEHSVHNQTHQVLHNSPCQVHQILPRLAANASWSVENPPLFFATPHLEAPPIYTTIHQKFVVALLPHANEVHDLMCLIHATELASFPKISSYLIYQAPRASPYNPPHLPATSTPILHESDALVVLRGSEINATFRTPRSMEQHSSEWRINNSFLAHYPGCGQWWRRLGSRLLIERLRTTLASKTDDRTLQLFDNIDVEQLAPLGKFYGRHTADDHRRFPEGQTSMIFGNVADRFGDPFEETRHDSESMWREGMKLVIKMLLDENFKNYSVKNKKEVATSHQSTLLMSSSEGVDENDKSSVFGETGLDASSTLRGDVSSLSSIKSELMKWTFAGLANIGGDGRRVEERKRRKEFKKRG